MPIFHVNFDLKADSKAIARLNSSGDELVKAMKKRSDAANRQNQTNGTGSNQGFDQFKNDMIRYQSQIEGMTETGRQLTEGSKLLQSVKKMINTPGTGIKSKLANMKQLWLSMTQTGRELNNSDLSKIIKIKKDIDDIMNQFSGLRYKGMSVFARKVNITNTSGFSLPFSNVNTQSNNKNLTGTFFSDTQKGANINFVRDYEDIRQNLVFIKNNIGSYIQKDSVTRNLENAILSSKNILSKADESLNKFSNLNNSIFYSKRRSLQERDQIIRNRQNELSVNAVVDILEK